MKNVSITLAAVTLAWFAGLAGAQQDSNFNTDNGVATTTTTNTKTTGNEFSHPTRAHGELITTMIGKWKTAATFWSAPDAAPTTTEGTTTMTVAMGGRFVQQDFVCKMGNTPFRGTGFFGFNNANQRLESFWIDNLSTGMLMSTGQRQNDGSIVWTGTYTDENGNTQTAKSITRFPSKDTIIFETYDVASTGTEFKTLEVTYNRTGTVIPALARARAHNNTNTFKLGPGRVAAVAAKTNTTNTTNTTKNFNTTNTTNNTTTDASGTNTTDGSQR